MMNEKGLDRDENEEPHTSAVLFVCDLAFLECVVAKKSNRLAV